MYGEPFFKVLCRETGRLLVELRYNNPFDMGRDGLRYTPFMDDRYLQRHSEADLELRGKLAWIAIAVVVAAVSGAALSGPLLHLLHGAWRVTDMRG
jgi:hypothetical protein